MEPKLKWVMIVMLALVNDWHCCSGCWEQERIALLHLKAHINHPNGNALPDWVEDKKDADCCKWQLIVCNTTTRLVTQLDLFSVRDFNLGDWYFNASVLLQQLDLSANQMVNWVKNEGFELKYLKFLNLGYNDLNNNIVSSLSGLSSLKTLILQTNRLKGSIQIKELDALSNLEELDIRYNNISEFMVPEGTKSLSKLQVLYLDNFFDTNASILLQSLGAFTSLRTLYFTSVTFEEINITQVLHGSSNLEDLILDRSSLNNNFLRYIGGLTSLKVLSLISCKLNDTLSAQGLCKLKNLEELSLRENDFVGPLPSCLGNLKSLRLLDVSYNQFTGIIALSPLNNLRVLDVSYNQLTGNIALSPLFNLTSLEYLSISSNLRVPISFKSFANNSNLKVILSDNNNLLAETTFQTWAPMFQLKVFSLSNCTSEGLDVGLPNFFYYQYDLRIVDLSHTSFKGTFPAWLLNNNTRLESLVIRNSFLMGFFQWPSRSCPSMSLIDISDNHLKGQLPKNMSSMFPNLQALDMSRNMLTDEIPSCIGNLSSLRVLALSNNYLSGVFPKELAIGCPSLFFLELSNNKLHGQLFPGSTTLSSLDTLCLDGNGFEGSIPESLSNTSISVFDISNNNISGKLPRWLGNHSYIYEVVMSSNHLEGAIPTEFCNVNGLVSLDLSENHLSGSIPSSCFGQPFRQVFLDKNRLSGPMPRAFDNSSSLVTLSLRYNNIGGRIPDWIGSLSSLSFLLLKANHFEGSIPYKLCQLNRLDILDLSQNHLTGPIPRCLGNLTYNAHSFGDYGIGTSSSSIASIAMLYVERTKLMPAPDINDHLPLNQQVSMQQLVEFTTKRISYLYMGDTLKLMSGIDLSCNQLSGKIPLEIGNLNNIRALNLSYNNLSGPIPATFSNLKQTESLDLSNNNLNGRIPPQLVEMTSLGTFSVAHNNLSGPTPERKFQFGTFEEKSYEGNPLLCGPPLNNSCNETGLTSPIPYPMDGEGEDGSLIDPFIFQVSFVVSYVAMLLGIVAVLYINPYWRRVWFYFIEVCIESCNYFFLEVLRKISNFIKM